MNEPWNDDWSDDEQLTGYMLDLTRNRNSLSLGLYGENELVGVSLGSIMHGCLGTEYYIYEFFIKRDRQQEGLGTVFLCEIESYVKTIGEIIYSCRPSGMFPHTHSIQRTDFRNWRDMSLWQKCLIKTTSPSLLPMS